MQYRNVLINEKVAAIKHNLLDGDVYCDTVGISVLYIDYFNAVRSLYCFVTFL